MDFSRIPVVEIIRIPEIEFAVQKYEEEKKVGLPFFMLNPYILVPVVFILKRLSYIHICNKKKTLHTCLCNLFKSLNTHCGTLPRNKTQKTQQSFETCQQIHSMGFSAI